MSRVGSLALIVGAALCPMVFTGCPSGVGTIDGVTTCLACHNGRVAEDMRYFIIGSHRQIACGVCHTGSDAHVQLGGIGGGAINPANWPVEQEAAVCAQCHKKEVKGYFESKHYATRIACDRCHDPHTPLKTVGPFANNILCQSCHLANWPTAAAVEAHTSHSVDPAGTGASRCVGCHMPPLTSPNVPGQEDRPHSHSWKPIPPMTSADQANNGETVRPNSCAGTVGCHDGTVPAAPVFNFEDPTEMTGLQGVYDFYFPAKAAESVEQ